MSSNKDLLPSSSPISSICAILDWSNPFPFHDELLQVFIPRMFYNLISYWKSCVRGTSRHIVYFSYKKKKAFRLPGRVVLGLPSPSPRVCTDGRTDGWMDVRWRQNQNFSDQRVTKFAYPWCSASSAKKTRQKKHYKFFQCRMVPKKRALKTTLSFIFSITYKS